jgi:hypothetical protein
VADDKQLMDNISLRMHQMEFISKELEYICSYIKAEEYSMKIQM